jgi:O-antigen/teichoic acid export membrane protein
VEPVVQRSSIRKNVAAMSSSQVVTWGLSMVAIVVVPRFLGPEVHGSWQLASSLWDISAVLVALGTAIYLQLEIARDNRIGLSMMAPVLVLRSMMFAVVSLAVALYVILAGGNRTFVIVVAVIGVSRLLATWTEVFGTAFLGLERMTTNAVVSAGIKLLGVVGVIGVLVVGFGVIGVVVVSAFSTLIGLVLMVWRFRSVARVEWAGWRDHLVPVARLSVPFMLVALANTTYRQIDVIVISNVAGDRDLGWYSAADIVAGSLLFPATVVLASVLPSMGRLHTQDPEALRMLVRRTFSLMLLVSVPIGLGTSVVAPRFATTMFGSAYSGTGDVLVVIGPVIIVTFGTTLLANLAMATDRKSFWVVLLFGAAVLTVPLDIVLVPWTSDRFDNGAIGGALAYVITELLQFGIGLAVVAPYIVTRTTVWRGARILAAGGIMFAAVWPFRDLLFVVPAAIGAVVYGVAVIVLRVLDDFERSLVRDTLSKLGLPSPW